MEGVDDGVTGTMSLTVACLTERHWQFALACADRVARGRCLSA